MRVTLFLISLNPAWYAKPIYYSIFDSFYPGLIIRKYNHKTAGNRHRPTHVIGTTASGTEVSRPFGSNQRPKPVQQRPVGSSGNTHGGGQLSNQQINGGIGHICVGDTSGKCNGPQNGAGHRPGGAVGSAPPTKPIQRPVVSGTSGGGSGTNGGGPWSNQQLNGNIGSICIGTAQNKCNGPQNGVVRPKPVPHRPAGGAGASSGHLFNDYFNYY